MKSAREIHDAIRTLLKTAVCDDTHPADRAFAAASVFALNWALGMWSAADFDSFLAGGPVPGGWRE